MATLTGNTIASTYTGLLSVNGAISTGAVEVVEDGAGTDTSLWLSNERCQIKLGTGTSDDFTINDGSNDILLVEGDTKDVTLLDDLILISDSAVVKFGADGDTTLTHTDGTGLTLNSTNKLCFNDATQFVQGSSGTVLSIGATDEIDLTATTIDINGAVDISGNITMADNASIGISDGDERIVFDDGGDIIFLECQVGIKDTTGGFNPSSGESLDAFLEIQGAGSAGIVLHDRSGTKFDLYSDGSKLQVNSTAPFAITAAGLVGIGTDSPSEFLTVEGDPGNNANLVKFKNSHSTVDNDDNILSLSFSGDASTTEGNFIIFGDSDTAEMGVIKASSATAVVDAYSDYRLKNTISTLTGGLTKINALRPVTFKYNSDSGNATHEGFIAHEVQEQIPYAVRGNKDAIKDDGSIRSQTFCIYQLIPQLVSAIKELSAKVTVLENA